MKVILNFYLPTQATDRGRLELITPHVITSTRSEQCYHQLGVGIMGV